MLAWPERFYGFSSVLDEERRPEVGGQLVLLGKEILRIVDHLKSKRLMKYSC